MCHVREWLILACLYPFDRSFTDLGKFVFFIKAYFAEKNPSWFRLVNLRCCLSVYFVRFINYTNIGSVSFQSRLGKRCKQERALVFQLLIED